MSVIGSNILAGSAGSGGEDALYVDDVFSTYVYKGNATARSINNGIDLDGEGGLVWFKNRDDADKHLLIDTERGESKALYSNETDAEVTTSGYAVTAFNSNGFSLAASSWSGENVNNEDIVSWSFRKAPGFFDVVTYTGTGSVRNISHNLGSTPGMIIVKQTSSTESWGVYHRSLAASETVLLSGTNMAFSSPNSWNSTAPTDSVFTVGTEARVNQNGQTYVAYLFAHNDQQFGTDGDEAIIHCGSFNGGGVLNSNTIEVNTGFEPQWVLIKRTETTSDWYIFDTMRGMDNDGNNDKALFPNDANAEGSPQRIWAYQNGFAFDEDLGGSSAEWIYMAIRRPNKPVEAGTDVFAIDTFTGSDPNYISGFPVDFFISREGGGVDVAGNDQYVGSRLTGKRLLKSNSTISEISSPATVFDYQDGHSSDTGSASSTKYSWMFKRAPGFFDVALYTGNGSTNNVTHNLESVPELIIVKRRDSSDEWPVYFSVLGNTKYSVLNSISASSTSTSYWNSTTPTSTQFTLGARQETNASGGKFIAVLFASLDGISKVGSYTGTGSDINVDCGFTAGARFVLIKRTDGTGYWYVWDSVRGIVAGNDPFLYLNSTAAQITNLDYIDPLNAGFTVTSSASAELNASGGTYAFLAIA